MAHASPAGCSLFYSYSHKDEKYRKKLETHLSALRRDNLISEWHDRKITGGAEWKGEIDVHLETAQLILLLISPDFIHSDYCHDVELKRALQRHEAKQARVIPIFVRPCDWSSAPFGKLQGFPTDGEPITKWKPQDSGYLDVAKGIRKTIQALMTADTKSDASLVAPPQIIKPAFCRDFTSCEYNRIKWTWHWSAATDRSSIEFIDRLETWCIACGKRIEPTDHSNEIVERVGGRDLYGTGRVYGGQNLHTSVPMTIYRCDDGCTNVTFSGYRTALEASVKREIERQATSRANQDLSRHGVAGPSSSYVLEVDVRQLYYEDTNWTGALVYVTPYPQRFRAELGLTNLSARAVYIKRFTLRVGERVYTQEDGADVVSVASHAYRELDLIFPVNEPSEIASDAYELEITPAVGERMTVAGKFPA